MRSEDPTAPVEVRRSMDPAKVSFRPEANIRSGSMLAGLYRSLAEFTVLSDHVRSAVDGRLAERLEVTGWANGILRIRLTQPALATHWRFQEPTVRRHLARVPALQGLKEIRLVLATPAAGPRAKPLPRTIAAPVAALRALAADEPHDRLRRALEALAAAAEQSRAAATAAAKKKPGS